MGRLFKARIAQYREEFNMINMMNVICVAQMYLEQWTAIGCIIAGMIL